MMLAALLLLAQAPIDAALLADLPKVEVALTAHGVTQQCSGPAVATVLAKLGYPSGEKLGGQALASGVVVRARDGYAVLLSLGEIDPTLGNKAAIIATTCGGKALGAQDGPYRLILPGEKRPARSARQVVTIEPIVAPLPSPPPKHH